MEIEELIRKTETTNSQEVTDDFDKNFKPKGAMAFFILLVALSLITWYGIYLLMLSRS